ncbi:ATP-binding protein [Micromonospora echinospora]|uniref:ATP-binding protein n=1 Tax=Micromonospora echinospora TaxID=1877 RepID=UPI003A836F54
MPVQTRRRPPSRESASAGRASASVVPPPRRGGGRGTDTNPKRKRRKDPLWARITVIVGAMLMMTSGAAIVGSKALIGQATGNISQQNLLGDAGKSDAEGGDTLEGPIDMLLLGVDARASWAADDVRADSIIVLHIPATHDQAYLISIPRDTEAQIPAFKKTGFTGATVELRQRIVLDLPAGLPPALGDRADLATVLTELTTNADKYSPPGSPIGISADADERTVAFRVVDEGIGIRPEHVERAFERFWQGESGDRRRYPGAGLGLYLVRRIVERRNGWVSLRPGTGGGTVAEVRLPRG